MSTAELEGQLTRFRSDYRKFLDEIHKVIVGHESVVEGAVVALLAAGHVLLEGVPGLGKTMLVKTLADALHLKFSRIQFTPDLMPADIVGTNIVSEAETGARRFRFEPGPVFANILLADEINRATPKTQSALLEAMQEKRVTVAGTTYDIEKPFLVMATQNPLEMEGTYPLPEAQLDRFFFKLKMTYPSSEELSTILNRTTGEEDAQATAVLDGEAILRMRRLVREVPIASHVQEAAIRIVTATHPDDRNAPELVRRFVRYGASPRGAQVLVLAGKALALASSRYNVSVADIRAAACPALRHRLILNFEGEAEGVDPDAIIQEAVDAAERETGA